MIPRPVTDQVSVENYDKFLPYELNKRIFLLLCTHRVKEAPHPKKKRKIWLEFLHNIFSGSFSFECFRACFKSEIRKESCELKNASSHFRHLISTQVILLHCGKVGEKPFLKCFFSVRRLTKELITTYKNSATKISWDPLEKRMICRKWFQLMDWEQNVPQSKASNKVLLGLLLTCAFQYYCIWPHGVPLSGMREGGSSMWYNGIMPCCKDMSVYNVTMIIVRVFLWNQYLVIWGQIIPWKTYAIVFEWSHYSLNNVKVTPTILGQCVEGPLYWLKTVCCFAAKR